MRNDVFVAIEHESHPGSIFVHGVFHCYCSAVEKLISVMAKDSNVHDGYLDYVSELEIDEMPMSYREYLENELCDSDTYEIVSTILSE